MDSQNHSTLRTDENNIPEQTRRRSRAVQDERSLLTNWNLIVNPVVNLLDPNPVVNIVVNPLEPTRQRGSRRQGFDHVTTLARHVSRVRTRQRGLHAVERDSRGGVDDKVHVEGIRPGLR